MFLSWRPLPAGLSEAPHYVASAVGTLGGRTVLLGRLCPLLLSWLGPPKVWPPGVFRTPKHGIMEAWT